MLCVLLQILKVRVLGRRRKARSFIFVFVVCFALGSRVGLLLIVLGDHIGRWRLNADSCVQGKCPPYWLYYIWQLMGDGLVSEVAPKEMKALFSLVNSDVQQFWSL